MEDEHTEIKIIASDEEYKIITTNPDELLKKSEKSKPKKELPKSKKHCTTKKTSKKTDNAKRKPVKSRKDKLTQKAKQRVSINVDEFKGFYRHKDLNLHEIKYLLAKKYQIIDKFSITSNKVEKFLIKPRFNESLNHFFLIYDISEFLENKGIAVKKFTTKKPDIVFELNEKKFAIEVETGTVYDKAKKQLIEKVKELKKNYDYWFFVVSDKKYVQKYRKLWKTVEKRYLANQLNKLVKNAEISPAKIKPRADTYSREKRVK